MCNIYVRTMVYVHALKMFVHVPERNPLQRNLFVVPLDVRTLLAYVLCHETDLSVEYFE